MIEVIFNEEMKVDLILIGHIPLASLVEGVVFEPLANDWTVVIDWIKGEVSD